MTPKHFGQHITILLTNVSLLRTCSVNIHVHVYNPDMPVSTGDCTITPAVLEHIYGLISSGQNSAHFRQLKILSTPPPVISPLLERQHEKFAWHYCITSRGNRTPDLLILRPMPCPPRHMLVSLLTNVGNIAGTTSTVKEKRKEKEKKTHAVITN